MASSPTPPWILGLDIGSASIGWAAIDPAGQQVLDLGVRIFDAGVDDAKFQKGEPGASNNADRRAQRLQRRQLRRRSGRARSLFLTLRRHGLLPASPGAQTAAPASQAASPEARQATFDALDADLRAKWLGRPELRAARAPMQVLPYFLRARALDEKLEPFELGRVFYHLGQRRGFHSNRADAKSERAEQRQKAEDDVSKVKGDIRALAGEIEAAGARTLGEFFFRLDPALPLQKIRRRWTARTMHMAEFAAIWAAQAPHHPALTPQLRERLEWLLYYQRPIAPGKPGACELERGQARAPRACLEAQRFRMLQKVNDLRLIAPTLELRELMPEERRALLDVLEHEGDLTFAQIRKRKLVSCPKGWRFNLDAGRETKIPGNRTAAKLRTVFAEGWDRMPAGERAAAVRLWMDPSLEGEAFRQRAAARFGRDADAAARWAELEPESGYARLSLRAMEKLMPLMEAGTSFKEAEKQQYGVSFSGGAVHGRLPAVAEFLPALANPAVMRALSELRRVVNALVRKWGKPFEVRIELARDLKRDARQREQLAESMREQQKRRLDAAAKITSEAGIPTPKRRDIEIALLFRQAGGICPYCGQPVSFQQAFEAQAAEVDHILPRSRFPDDSFGNKVLAHYSCNQEKRGRTPFEAFGHDANLWDQMLNRVRSWGDWTKLEAFQVRSPEDLDAAREGSFAARRLGDTRYATTQAAKYLSALYGGRDEAQSDGSTRRVIFASSGLTTATLRHAWCLEEILSPETGRKNRQDHRHHAVDALVIALTSNAAIRQMSAAAAADVSGRGRVTSRALQAPWNDFVDRLRPRILGINVSHRPKHRLRGQLHDETNFSPAIGGRSHKRVAVEDLSPSQVAAIVDSRIREAVQKAIAAHGSAKALVGDKTPMLEARSGARIPIRRVRVNARPASGVTEIAGGARQRQVVLANNHHLEVFVGRDLRGREKWQCRIVTRLEACRRRARCRCQAGAPCFCVVNRRWEGDGEFEFLFSLMAGDTVELRTDEADAPRLFVLRSISDGDYWFMPNTLTGNVKRLQREGRLVRIRTDDGLRQRACRKVEIDVLGRVFEAGG